jgi:hypothetical protein
MKIILEGKNHRAEIEVKNDHLTIGEVYESFIEPVLLAYGFQKESIEGYYKEISMSFR